MKLLLLAALCVVVAVVSAGHFQQRIHKQLPNGKTIMLRRANKQPMRPKYQSKLKTGSQKFDDFVNCLNIDFLTILILD
jgi:hypothetical protein